MRKDLRPLPNQRAVLIDRPDAVQGDGMQHPFMILQLKNGGRSGGNSMTWSGTKNSFRSMRS